MTPQRPDVFEIFDEVNRWIDVAQDGNMSESVRKDCADEIMHMYDTVVAAAAALSRDNNLLEPIQETVAEQMALTWRNQTRSFDPLLIARMSPGVRGIVISILRQDGELGRELEKYGIDA